MFVKSDVPSVQRERCPIAKVPILERTIPLLLLTRICADPMILGRSLWELFSSLTSVFR
jgi:hypothetical protein